MGVVTHKIPPNKTCLPKSAGLRALAKQHTPNVHQTTLEAGLNAKAIKYWPIQWNRILGRGPSATDSWDLRELAPTFSSLCGAYRDGPIGQKAEKRSVAPNCHGGRLSDLGMACFGGCFRRAL